MQPWTKAVIFGAVSAAAIGATYTRAPDSDFAGAAMAYNVTFYIPLVLLSFVCWVVAVSFYIVFVRQRASKPVLKVVAPAVLLLPFMYESIVIVRYIMWIRQFA